MRGLEAPARLALHKVVNSSPALATPSVQASLGLPSSPSAAASASFPPPAVPHSGCRPPSLSGWAQPSSLSLALPRGSALHFFL